jgi:hypothetical protein
VTSNRVQAIYHQSTGAIVNNLVYSNAGGTGILLWHDPRDITIAHNTLFDNDWGIAVGAGDWYHENKPAENIRVVNNIVFDNRGGGITEEGLTGTNNLYLNNLVYRNAVDWSLGNGLKHQATITADPQFVDYRRGGGGNYRLRASSPAIDKGVTENGPKDDIEGRPRPYGGAADIGAYEWRPENERN